MCGHNRLNRIDPEDESEGMAARKLSSRAESTKRGTSVLKYELWARHSDTPIRKKKEPAKCRLFQTHNRTKA